jgi:hypothetical protein
MSDTTTPTRDRLRRWRTPIVAAAVSGGVLLGGYGIAAAADSASPTPDGESSETAPPTPSAPESEAPESEAPDATEPNRTRPDGPGRGEGCDEAPSDRAPSDEGTAESSATATT